MQRVTTFRICVFAPRSITASRSLSPNRSASGRLAHAFPECPGISSSGTSMTPRSSANFTSVLSAEARDRRARSRSSSQVPGRRWTEMSMPDRPSCGDQLSATFDRFPLDPSCPTGNFAALSDKSAAESRALHPFRLRRFGVLAQLVERLNGIEEVRGSNPLGSTTSSSRYGLCRNHRRHF